MLALLIGIVILVIIVIFVWMTYNGLVKGRVRVKGAWADIDVQLKRRSSLIPNLVETVKGYAAHEKDTLDAVTRARAQLDTARQGGNAQQAAQADNVLTGTLRSLFAVAEAYPDLKANQSFQELQRELTDTEDKVAYSRQFYNSVTGDYNTKIAVFPAVILAGMFGFHAESFFQADEEARADVKVSFGTS